MSTEETNSSSCLADLPDTSQSAEETERLMGNTGTVSVADFDFVQSIGGGASGMCQLVKRKNEVDGRFYVIKTVSVRHLSDEEKERCMDEARLLSRLHHPNIIGYREHFFEEDELHIVTDYADGGDLGRFIELATRPFSEEKILDVFMQLVLAIKYIHSINILHRDLKPANIYITQRGIVKLGDFGVAKALDSTSELAQTVTGTPHCLAPELWESRPYNHKSDMWSLGCVLVELCARKPAFAGKSLPALMLAALNDDPVRIPAIYSQELRDLAAQLLRKDPQERPDAAEICHIPVVRSAIERFVRAQQLLKRMQQEPADADAAASPGPVAAEGTPVTPGPSAASPGLEGSMSLSGLAAQGINSSESNQSLAAGLPGTPVNPVEVPWHEHIASHSPSVEAMRKDVLTQAAVRRRDQSRDLRKHSVRYRARLSGAKPKVHRRTLAKDHEHGTAQTAAPHVDFEVVISQKQLEQAATYHLLAREDADSPPPSTSTDAHTEPARSPSPSHSKPNANRPAPAEHQPLPSDAHAAPAASATAGSEAFTFTNASTRPPVQPAATRFSPSASRDSSSGNGSAASAHTATASTATGTSASGTSIAPGTSPHPREVTVESFAQSLGLSVSASPSDGQSSTGPGGSGGLQTPPQPQQPLSPGARPLLGAMGGLPPTPPATKGVPRQVVNVGDDITPILVPAGPNPYASQRSQDGHDNDKDSRKAAPQDEHFPGAPATSVGSADGETASAMHPPSSSAEVSEEGGAADSHVDNDIDPAPLGDLGVLRPEDLGRLMSLVAKEP